MANIDTAAYNEGAVGGPDTSPVRVYRYAFVVADEPTVADHVRFFKLPKNVKIAFIGAHSTDIDTHGTPTCDFNVILSDGSTDKILIEGTANAIAETGGSDLGQLVTVATNEPGIGFVTDSDDWYVALDWITACATAAAGTITVACIYTTVLDGGA